MKDENNPKKLKNFIKNHPKISIATASSAGTGAFTVAIGKISGLTDGIEFPVSVELLNKIWLIISSNGILFLAVIICICITIYKCLELSYRRNEKKQKWKFMQALLDKASPLLKEDDTITTIKMETGEEDIGLSVSRNENKKETGSPQEQKKGNNILEFRKLDDLEAK